MGQKGIIMENRKYIFDAGDPIIHEGHELYTIIAVRDFGSGYHRVLSGDAGGCIENEGNLSHEGDCWIFDGCVYGTAQVLGDTIIGEPHRTTIKDTTIHGGKYNRLNIGENVAYIEPWVDSISIVNSDIRCIVQDAHVRHIEAESVCIGRIDILGASFTDSMFTDVVADHASRIDSALFNRCTFNGCNFTKLDFHSCSFCDCTFNKCTFRDGMMDTTLSNNRFYVCEMDGEPM